MKKPVSSVSRRSFTVGAAGMLAAPMVLRASRAAAKSDSVTMVGWGGTYQETLEKYAIKPFTEETGIKVNMVPAPDLAKIKGQLLTGNVEWDVYDTDDAEMASGSLQGFWEKLDPSMFDVADMQSPPTSDSVPWTIGVIGIAWDPKKYTSEKHPSNFAEYFDLKKFPGRRVFRNYPQWTLESALLADGVAPKDVYPLDLDRGFKVLDRIKTSVASWTKSNAQTLSLLQSGEADFACIDSNRVKATNVSGGGVPLAFSFKQNVFYSENLAVLKGAPNKENALKLVAYLLRPQTQTRVVDQLGLVPVSKKAATMLSAEARKWQPDLSNPDSLFVNAAYWAAHFEAVNSHFMEWKQT